MNGIVVVPTFQGSSTEFVVVPYFSFVIVPTFKKKSKTSQRFFERETTSSREYASGFFKI